MKKYDDDFLNGVWAKIEEKEENRKILEFISEDLSVSEKQSEIRMAKIFSRLGLSGIFGGMCDVIVVSFALTICICFFLWRAVCATPDLLYVQAFLGAPVLYTAMMALTFIKENQMNTYEIQMSCKYTFCHLIAFRMLIGGSLSLIFNLVHMVFLWQQFDVQLIRLLALSFSSVLIFACLLLAGMIYFKKQKLFFVFPGIWMLFNLGISLGFFDAYAGFVERIPVLVLGGIVLLGAVLMGVGTARLIKIDFRKGYAGCCS